MDLTCEPMSEEWLHRACVLDLWYDYDQHPANYRFFSRHQTPMDVWNWYIRGYMNQSNIPQTRALFLRYEDLVLCPDVALNKIMQASRQPFLKRPKVVNENAKIKHYATGFHSGQPHYRRDYILNITNRTYLEVYPSMSTLKFVCSKLDIHLMHLFKYHDCDQFF